MSRVRVVMLVGGLVGLGLAGGRSAPVAPLQASAHFEVIASGLDNPRGLAFSPDGGLYVAEAGHGDAGGPVPDGGPYCKPAADAPPPAVVCWAPTGAITRVDPSGAAAPVRLVSGLPSLAPPAGPRAGFGAGGPVDISFLGRGGAYVVIGLGGDPAFRNPATLGPQAHLFGTVLHVAASGRWQVVADIAGQESTENPAGGTIDSNPYGIAALPGRRVVADAGGNSLIEAAANGLTQTLAVFPNRALTAPPVTIQAVPTTVTEGPDGWLYVGQLTGGPFVVGAANVYRVPPEGGTPQVYAGGFTGIVDLAFDGAGNLYVLEIIAGGAPPSPPGRLIRVNTDGTRTTILGGLTFPGGVAVGPDGAVYLTNFGIFPTSAGGGQVLKIAEP